jgi:GNAT superfamily N-acetyltransferase
MASSSVHIRLALPSDIPHVSSLENASDNLFLSFGMKEIAEIPPIPFESYEKHRVLEQLWVATLPPELADGEARESVGFVQVDCYENNGVYRTAYVHQISVSPKHSRKGIGKQMLEFVEKWATSRSFEALDLTTFDHVPWNRPYYERLGFKVLTEEELSNGEMKSVREELKTEREDKLLGQWPRVAMRKIIVDDNGTPILSHAKS